MSNRRGVLYVVATPIGNLDDLSPRARAILGDVDLIAAEDTRHSGQLTARFGIPTPLRAYHEHNEREEAPRLIELLRNGQNIALVSDAGTPLISDPGFRLIAAAHAAGVQVVPVPGPCAAIAALSVAGLPSDRFVFEGFPPPKTAARRARFEALRHETGTMIFYESPHRIQECLADLTAVFGDDRRALFARELTKQFETLRAASLRDLRDWVASDPDQSRGEIVLVVAGAAEPDVAALSADQERLLKLLLNELSPSRAAALVAEYTGLKRSQVYDAALKWKSESSQ